MTNERATEIAVDSLAMFKQRMLLLDMYDSVIMHTAYAIERAADEGKKDHEAALASISFSWDTTQV